MNPRNLVISSRNGALCVQAERFSPLCWAFVARPTCWVSERCTHTHTHTHTLTCIEPEKTHIHTLFCVEVNPVLIRQQDVRVFLFIKNSRRSTGMCVCVCACVCVCVCVSV